MKTISWWISFYPYCLSLTVFSSYLLSMEQVITQTDRSICLICHQDCPPRAKFPCINNHPGYQIHVECLDLFFESGFTDCPLCHEEIRGEVIFSFGVAEFTAKEASKWGLLSVFLAKKGDIISQSRI